MPTKITDAKIMLLDAPIEFTKTEVSAEITFTHPDQMQAFLTEEERMVKHRNHKSEQSSLTEQETNVVNHSEGNR